MKTWKDYKFGLVFGEEKKCLFEALISLRKKFSKVNIIEVGFNRGLTGKALLDICADNNFLAKYWGIDIRSHKGTIKDKRMMFLMGDANDSLILVRLPEKFHFVFIDSCHCYYCVQKQFKVYNQKIVKDGIIAFHDYAESFQGTSLTEPHGKDKKVCEVRKAVQDLKLREIGYEELSRNEEHNGIILFRKKE